ncbi:aminoglycoside phosphotransferase family protein [Epibacterium ulvae]|uniref:phosphotransferase family protein n=1 Tax=Epibacterium ulvae TaxID=1156985 RepID=UPI001BFC2A2B|nr:aminoglycoside phosphotransferase family protein [Epibacterium ulvae]MBT8155775.1 aminoglycoside phosphotransferase family protein [Epibacterium ulvae]
MQGGRSNCVFRIGNSVLKVFDPNSSNPLFCNDPDRETSMLRALADTGLGPRLRDVGLNQGLRWILYDHLPGDSWASGTTDVARLLAKVHDQPQPSDMVRGPNGSVELILQSHDILHRCADQQALKLLEPMGSVGQTYDVTLLHGDPVPGNILVSEQQIQLIDWQCPVVGDPAEDLAIFLSPAMQFLYRGKALTPQEETHFLDAYPYKNRVARYLDLQPWYLWRMANYCNWRSQDGDPRDHHAMGLEIQKLKSLNA